MLMQVCYFTIKMELPFKELEYRLFKWVSLPSEN